MLAKKEIQQIKLKENFLLHPQLPFLICFRDVEFPSYLLKIYS